jgi:hypothetical protein
MGLYEYSSVHLSFFNVCFATIRQKPLYDFFFLIEVYVCDTQHRSKFDQIQHQIRERNQELKLDR